MKNSHLYGGPTVRNGSEVPGRSWTDYILQGVPARTDGGSAGDNWDVGQGFENNPRRRNLYIASPFYPLIRLSEDGSNKPLPFYELGDFHYKLETQDDLKKGMLFCVGPGYSRATRPPDDKSPCDIRFGNDPFIMKLRPGMQGNTDAAKGEIISVSPYCADSFGSRDLIYEGDNFVWFRVAETYGSALGAQQDVN